MLRHNRPQIVRFTFFIVILLVLSFSVVAIPPSTSCSTTESYAIDAEYKYKKSEVLSPINYQRAIENTHMSPYGGLGGTTEVIFESPEEVETVGAFFCGTKHGTAGRTGDNMWGVDVQFYDESDYLITTKNMYGHIEYDTSYSERVPIPDCTPTSYTSQSACQIFQDSCVQREGLWYRKYPCSNLVNYNGQCKWPVTTIDPPILAKKIKLTVRRQDRLYFDLTFTNYSSTATKQTTSSNDNEVSYLTRNAEISLDTLPPDIIPGSLKVDVTNPFIHVQSNRTEPSLFGTRLILQNPCIDLDENKVCDNQEICCAPEPTCDLTLGECEGSPTISHQFEVSSDFGTATNPCCGNNYLSSPTANDCGLITPNEQLCANSGKREPYEITGNWEWLPSSPLDPEATHKSKIVYNSCSDQEFISVRDGTNFKWKSCDEGTSTTISAERERFTYAVYNLNSARVEKNKILILTKSDSLSILSWTKLKDQLENLGYEVGMVTSLPKTKTKLSELLYQFSQVWIFDHLDSVALTTTQLEVLGEYRNAQNSLFISSGPEKYTTQSNSILNALSLITSFPNIKIKLGDDKEKSVHELADTHPVGIGNALIYMSKEASKIDSTNSNLIPIGKSVTPTGVSTFLAAIEEPNKGKIILDSDMKKYSLLDDEETANLPALISSIASWLEARDSDQIELTSQDNIGTFDPGTNSALNFKVESSNPNVELFFENTGTNKISGTQGNTNVTAKLKSFTYGPATPITSSNKLPLVTEVFRDYNDPEFDDSNDPRHSVLCTANNGIGSIVECCGASDQACFTDLSVANPDQTRKKFGDSITLAIKNPNFDLSDTRKNPLYWHSAPLPSSTSPSKYQVKPENTGGTTNNNVLLLEYNGGEINGIKGVYAASDMFPITQDTQISFYYKTDMPKEFDTKITAYLAHYAALDKSSPNPTSLPPPADWVELIDKTESLDWTKVTVPIPKLTGRTHARIFLRIEKNNKRGTGKVMFDKFILGSPYFCTTGQFAGDTQWVNDLSGTTQTACEQAGDKEFGNNFVWTGSHCCGDQTGEYYNDVDSGEAGCWDGKKVNNNEILSTDSRILNHEGKFYACNIPTTDPLIQNAKDSSGDLVVDPRYDEIKSSCSTLRDSTLLGNIPGWYCSTEGIWKNTPSSGPFIAVNRTKLSNVPPFSIAEVRQECCPENRCWNGQTCVEDQTEKPFEGPTNGYRCDRRNDGTVNWSKPIKKSTWDNLQEGFCPSINHCLVPSSDSPTGKLKCISSGEYVQNHYCDTGNWTTRTRLAAQTLLKYGLDTSPDDFSLYCDKIDNSLNDLQYNPTGDPIATASSFLLGAGAEHACILKTSDKTLFAAAANKQINSLVTPPNVPSQFASNYNFLRLFSNDTSTCDTAILNDNTFTQCNENGLWINNQTLLMIYSKDDITDFGGIDTIDNLLQFLVDPLQKTVDFIVNTLRPKVIASSLNLDIIDSPKDFTRFYFSKAKLNNRDLIVRGAIETHTESRGITKDLLTMEFQGFSRDICNSIEIYDDEKINELITPISNTDDITCMPVINNNELFYRVLMQKPSGTIRQDFWEDLTTKLRLQNAIALSSGSVAPTAQILHPLSSITYKVSNLVDSGFTLAATTDTNALSYYWNIDTQDSYTGPISSSNNKTFTMSFLYGVPRKVSGLYNISLIVIGKDGSFSVDSVPVTFESILGKNAQQGCLKRLGDMNDDNRVTLADYPLLRQRVHNCIQTYTQNPSTSLSGNYEGTDINCVCADIDQDAGGGSFTFGADNVPYVDETGNTDDSKLDLKEFVDLCENCDLDSDGFIDDSNIDNCIGTHNPDQLDTDRVRDLSNTDNAEITLFNYESSIGDACDTCTDPDADGYGSPGFSRSGCESPATYDNCPDNADYNPDQLDKDADGLGNVCDPDADNDGILNEQDNTLLEGDCSLQDATDCGARQTFNTDSGCCESIPNFPEPAALYKDFCLKHEVALLYLSSESNAHASLTPLPGYKPLCYPKSPISILDSTDCTKTNSAITIKLPGTTNTHAAQHLASGTINTIRKKTHLVSGSLVTLPAQQKIGEVIAEVCASGTISGSQYLEASANWGLSILDNTANTHADNTTITKHTSPSCQQITGDFKGATANKLVLGLAIYSQQTYQTYGRTKLQSHIKVGDTCFQQRTLTRCYIGGDHFTWMDNADECTRAGYSIENEMQILAETPCTSDPTELASEIKLGQDCYKSRTLTRCYSPGDHFTWVDNALECTGAGYTIEEEIKILAKDTCSTTSPSEITTEIQLGNTCYAPKKLTRCFIGGDHFTWVDNALECTGAGYTVEEEMDIIAKLPRCSPLPSNMKIISYEEITGGIQDVQSVYTTDSCIQSDSSPLVCTYDEQCRSNEFCLVTLSNGSYNLHLSSCDAQDPYSQKVCCTAGTQMRDTCITKGLTDAECAQKCGDGTLQSPNSAGEIEQCDKQDFGTALGDGKSKCSTHDLQYVKGSLQCTQSCEIDTTGCFTQDKLDIALQSEPAPLCGNKIVDTDLNEQCDTRNLNGITFCSELLDVNGNPLFTSGKPGCFLKGHAKACQYDTTNCKGGTCGDKRLQTHEVCDSKLPLSKDCTTIDQATYGPFTGGTLSCTNLCGYDTSQCTPPPPTTP